MSGASRRSNDESSTGLLTAEEDDAVDVTSVQRTDRDDARSLYSRNY